MKAMIGCVAILLSMMVIISEATATDESNASLPKRRSRSTIVSPSPIVNVKGEKDKIEDVADAIDFLKSYPVSKIESGMVDSSSFIYRKLPQISLEKWLGSILGDMPLEWKADDCATYDSDVDDNDKHCVSFSVSVRTPQWHCPEVNLSFAVGTDGAVHFLNDNSIVNDFGAKESMQQIAELKETLEKVKAKTTPNRQSSLPAASLKAMTDNDMIMHVRALDVHTLDPSLSTERFDKWLERTSRWPLQWRQASALEEYHPRCEPKRLVIRVYPASIVDPGNRRPPADIQVDIGSWERGIEGEPKLQIYFKGPSDSNVSNWFLKDLHTLQKKFDEWNAVIKNSDAWNASILARRSSIMPIPAQGQVAKVPVVQNMTKLGFYSRIRSTPSGHCYGLELSLWKYGERVFGTLYDLDGQCADSRAPTYMIRDVKYDSTTGNLEFWSYGTPGYKFVGKLDQNMVSGKFLGMYEEEEVKLKRSKDDGKPLPDSEQNVAAWCKDYAPNLRYVVEKDLEELCKSLGVQ